LNFCYSIRAIRYVSCLLGEETYEIAKSAYPLGACPMPALWRENDGLGQIDIFVNVELGIWYQN
jgi:hypothetical protein